MGWLIGGGIAALLILLGKRQQPGLPTSVANIMQQGRPITSYGRSGTAGPGAGIPLGGAGVRGCCGTAPVTTLGTYIRDSAGNIIGTTQGVTPFIARPVSLRPTTPPATPGVPPVSTGRYITRLGVIAVPVAGKPGYFI